MKEEIKRLSEMADSLETAYSSLTQLVLKNLRGKSIESLKEELKDDPPRVLQHIHDLAFDAELYEICAATQELLKTRGTN